MDRSTHTRTGGIAAREPSPKDRLCTKASNGSATDASSELGVQILESRRRLRQEPRRCAASSHGIRGVPFVDSSYAERNGPDAASVIAPWMTFFFILGNILSMSPPWREKSIVIARMAIATTTRTPPTRKKGSGCGIFRIVVSRLRTAPVRARCCRDAPADQLPVTLWH